MGFVYRTKIDQRVEVEGLACVVPAGTVWEDEEKLEPDDTFEIDPRWMALQQWWLGREVCRAADRGDTRFINAVGIADLGPGGFAVSLADMARIEAYTVQDVAAGVIAPKEFQEKMADIRTMVEGLRALKERSQ
jgi:hypothetical protein